ncbi:hypothetical protein FSP39_012701 [Pinctada imbricata]|uniref:Replication factor C subunit 1 n=1 Tax=Pinctada imbricata TaxID=66713 RepID=A0AA88XM89_PINIB|nr:hypothetical protein FSP39_012701 [Pinctada imbricata]
MKKTRVNVSDFFGGASVKRDERKTVAAKRKLQKVSLTPEKESKKEEKSSLASKLSSKAKAAETPERQSDKKEVTLVADTPIQTKKSPKKPSPKKGSRVVFTPKKSPGESEKASTPKSDKPVTPASVQKKTSPSKTSPETPASLKKGNPSFRSYLAREGPRSLGAKEVPEGGDNCLEGLTFVITGIQESFERDELKSIIEKYGGKVTGSLSKKTSYLLTGRDSGESKIKNAEGFGTKLLDEDGFLNLLRTLPGKKSNYEVQAKQKMKKEKSIQKKTDHIPKDEVKPNRFSQYERKPSPTKTTSQPSSQPSPSISNSQSSTKSLSPKKETDQSDVSLLWVDKYKPTSVKQIIGRFFNKNDDGSGHRAALLSGPPGIGKTTTATLVCKEAGFSYVELNASDTRSKKSLKEVVSQSLSNTTMVDYIDGSAMQTNGKKHCLLMDEVDGMAGNEDRGGINELVQLVKATHIPIICMCNDRNHQKMRTLSNYCFDLRFQKPRMEQIKGAMMSIAYKEGLKIPPPALNEIILGANQDIRQVIHNLSMWTAADKAITYEQAKKDSNSAKKDFKLGPFDVCRKVFVGGEETAGMTIHDKSDLFFHDYSFGPLFVQENYINVIPFAAKGNTTRHLSQLARAADSICNGDIVSSLIRGSQRWSLLPTAAIYSSVLPGEYMRGSFPQMVAFPSWLGKNSSQGKTDRILQELRTHMRLQTSADKRSLNMDYLPYMRNSLTEPLVRREGEGVPEVIQLMDEYDIIKEDYDNILEVTKWPNSKDPMAALSSKTKAAFTRTYNKEVHMTPYATGTISKKKKGGAGGGEDLEALGEGEDGGATQESDEEEEEGLENDTMILKQTKKKADSKASTTKKGKGAETTKGKGKGKGKGKS